MRIALIVDHPQRDLPGLTLVAHRLCREGMRCFLIPFDMQPQEVLAVRPDFVLLNFLRRTNESFAWNLTRLGIRFGVLDTEGALLKSVATYGSTIAHNQRVREQAVFFSSWGRCFAKEVCSFGWYREDQVRVTGCPRFDYYAAPWRQAVWQWTPQTLSRDGGWVLINGSFPMANPMFQSPGEEIDMYVKRFGLHRKAIVDYQENQRRTLMGLVELTNRLARRFPDISFVYRPHPFERLSTYEPLLERRDNLRLVRTGTVDGWIVRSRAVIQRSCSTAIEAALVGVPALSPTWIPTNPQPLPEAVSVPCRSEEELVVTLESIWEGRFQTPVGLQERLDRLVEDWFYRIDGMAHERVAVCILRSLPNESSWERLPEWRSAYYGARLRGQSLRSMTSGMVRTWLGITQQGSPQRWQESEKHFDATQVERLVQAISACASNGSGKKSQRVGVKKTQGDSVELFPISP